MYKVRETHPGDRFGDATGSEASYLKDMRNIIADLHGPVDETVGMYFDDCALQSAPPYVVADVVGRDFSQV